MINSPIPAQAASSSTALTRLSDGTGVPASSKMYQIEPRSPCRSELKVQNSSQDSGAKITTGRFTTDQLIRNAPTQPASSFSFLVRMQSSTSGPSSNSG